LLPFARNFIRKIQEDDLFALSAQLTYAMLMAFFPFVLFLLTLVGFFQMDAAALLAGMRKAIPADIMGVVDDYIVQVVITRNAGLLSVSLAVALYNSSTVFQAVIRCVNLANGRRDERKWISKALLSILLVLVLVLALTVAVAAAYITWMFAAVILWLVTIAIYRVADCEKTTFRRQWIGAAATVVLWLVSTWALRIYMEHFFAYSKVYGSVGGIFALLLWLNLTGMFLLLGCEVNAVLFHGKN